MRKGKILIPKGQKERKSVTFAIRLRTILWYDREGVKFRDSGSEIERNIAKRQICLELHKLVSPEDFYLDQNTIPLSLRYFHTYSNIFCGTIQYTYVVSPC